jgi:hypothetical protein
VGFDGAAKGFQTDEKNKLPLTFEVKAWFYVKIIVRGLINICALIKDKKYVFFIR